MAYVAPSIRTTGDIITASIWNSDIYTNEPALAQTGFTVIIEGGGAVVTTGAKNPFEVPFTLTLTSVTVTSDVTTTTVIDLWKCTYALYDVSTHPVDGDSVTSASPITIAAAKKSTDTSLSGWTKAWTQGDWVLPNVDSNSAATKLSISFKGTM